ncbi:hypothetical protein JAAARDRAFT_82099 [Jaapia argillacea MUCL 33604]|uniref:Uncharacterized protein n=1 Tax=Jaapia argillacea MUCL 33604 TaxID=933084 RepID=A0A067PFD3_9AGAM|nr:hypothetical protein JAAARDRAFT_82099 [Jaapia argillacea MUCL 33604]
MTCNGCKRRFCKKPFGWNDSPVTSRGTSPVNEVHTGDSNLRSVVPESSNTDPTPTLGVGVSTSAPIPSAVYDLTPSNDTFPIGGGDYIMQELFQEWDNLNTESFPRALYPPPSEFDLLQSPHLDLGLDDSQMDVDEAPIFGSIAPGNMEAPHPMTSTPVYTMEHGNIHEAESARLALTRFLDIIGGAGVSSTMRGDLLALARRELDKVPGAALANHSSEQFEMPPPPGPSQEQTVIYAGANLEPSYMTFSLPGTSAPSRRTSRIQRDEMILSIKQYLLNKLFDIGAHVSSDFVPWSTLPRLVEERGCEIVNWPKGVRLPFSPEDKGVRGRPKRDIDLLYKAITNPDESCRLTFQPSPSVASGSGVQSMSSEPDALGGAAGVVTMRVRPQGGFRQ